MRYLFSRYILRTFFRLFGLALGAFVGLYLLIEFFERIDDLIEHHAPIALGAAYFLYKIPLIVSQVTPLACLLAVFLTLGGLTRSGELIAMHAGGISLAKVAFPLLRMGLYCSLIILAANEFIVPPTVQKAKTILSSEVKGGPSVDYKQNKIWLRHNKQILNIQLAIPARQTLEGISLLSFDDKFHIRRRLDAKSALFKTGQWHCEKVIDRTFDPDTGSLKSEQKYPVKTVSLPVSPEDFKQPGSKHNEDLSISELKRMARKLRSEGYDPTRFEVDLQARIATPFACLVMAFLGIPFAIRKGRGSSLALGIAISIAIGAVYVFLHAALLAFGYSGTFPPLVAAWGANVLFLMFATWLFLSNEG